MVFTKDVLSSDWIEKFVRAALSKLDLFMASQLFTYSRLDSFVCKYRKVAILFTTQFRKC